MNRKYVFKTFGIFCLALVVVYGGFLINRRLQHHQNCSSSELNANDENYAINKKIRFIKPTYNSNEKKHLTRIEIEVKDDQMSPDGKIMSVFFDDNQLTLHPSDQHGKRGSTLLHRKAGVYTLVWTVKNNPYAEQKETTNTHQVTISPTDLWIHINIVGKKVSIN